ncbi:arginyl-tRNA synthetase, class Ic [Artemisia annua]|uniref:arginine--tRNA ligase n=1 Tax=Artemisia annua TaxID=35608 RepID=A0A2U1NKQ2_ARTAN|nr:arginyl-tRNA synthetase, class Ic [Artemisia annua]
MDLYAFMESMRSDSDEENQMKRRHEMMKKIEMKKRKLKKKKISKLPPMELQPTTPPAQAQLQVEEKLKLKGPSADTTTLLITYIQALRSELQLIKMSRSPVNEEEKKLKVPASDSDTTPAAKEEDNRWSLQEEIAKVLTYALWGTFPPCEEAVSCSVSTCTKEDGADYLCTSILHMWPQVRDVMTYNGPKYAGLTLMDNLKLLGYDEMMDRRIVCGPGFLKFTLSREWIVKSIHKMLNHGIDTWAPKLPVKRAVIDFFSRNIHMGHLRSTVIGETLARMLEYSKVDVLRRSHDENNLDIKLKMMMTEFLVERFPNGEVNDQAIGEIEGWDERHHNAWVQICKLNRERYQKGKSFYDFDIRILDLWREMSSTIESERDEAILIEGRKLPLVDLAALWHALKIVKADWIVRVTDVGQQDNTEMCITAAKRAGWIESDQLHRPLSTVGIGLVQGDDFERFLTLGTKVVNLGNLLDAAKSHCKAVLVGQGKADEWTAEELEHTAEALGYGAVKYAHLKNNRLTSYTFSFDQMLNGQGNTAVYLQYTHVRICSIIRKSSKEIKELKVEELILKNEEEREFGLHLLRFTEVLKEVCTVLMPHILCDYLYDLCMKFDSLYSSACQADRSCDEETAELLLCEAAAIVMEKCFHLLGITPIYKI